MTILKPARIASSRFTYDKATKSFIAEDSDFGGKGHPVGRVYDDACDEGFTIVSERTGKEVVFALHMVHKDADGDLTKWEYHSVTPGHKGYRAVILND